eukprot:m.21518 g.21518  ORF g.21518 m.21518 type:complete len:258 (-) comp12448_c0_seq2:2580-3353(-)
MFTARTCILYETPRFCRTVDYAATPRKPSSLGQAAKIKMGLLRIKHNCCNVLLTLFSLSAYGRGQHTNYDLELRIAYSCPVGAHQQTIESADFKSNVCTKFPQIPHTELAGYYFHSSTCGDGEVPNLKVYGNVNCSGSVMATFTARVGHCAVHNILNLSVGIIVDEMDSNNVCTPSPEDELSPDDDAAIGIAAALVAGLIIICGSYVYYDKRLKLYKAAASTNVDTSVDEEQQMQLMFGEETIADLTHDSLRLDRGM